MVEAAAPQGWGDEESESSVPDVRSWFTKSTGRSDPHSFADKAHVNLRHLLCRSNVGRFLLGCSELNRIPMING